MMTYHLSANQLSNHWLTVELEVAVNNRETVTIQQSAWRPGRYELGNFAKNVRDFEVVNENGEVLTFQKVRKDRWVIQTQGVTTIKVSYNYYANELNAGSTFVNEHQIYMNPVNALMYDVEQMNVPCEVHIPSYDDWELACSESGINEHRFTCSDVHHLFDTPFIYSDELKHHAFNCEGVLFHLWFNGESKPDFTQLQKDFEPFIKSQKKLFGSFPFDKAYHFLFQIVPYAGYHGVEHLNNTVIYLGPSYRITQTESHNTLLGVSSHELFHSWNVKTIRPAEMYPYNYEQENYNHLGYVTEGFTTYYGDLMLWRSGVWTDEVYLKVLGDLITRHIHNFGRFNYSVAESSFDTWLDGYEAGAPDRKTSIYTEGAMVALLLDLSFIIKSEGKLSLDDVMRRLYDDAKVGKAYSESFMQALVEELGGKDILEILKKGVYGREDLLPLISEQLKSIGVELNLTDMELCETQYGFKVIPDGEAAKVVAIYPNSIAEQSGLVVGDVITSINQILLHKDINEWLAYFKEDDLVFRVMRLGRANMIDIVKGDGSKYYQKVELAAIDKSQKFNYWKLR